MNILEILLTSLLTVPSPSLSMFLKTFSRGVSSPMNSPKERRPSKSLSIRSKKSDTSSLMIEARIIFFLIPLLCRQSWIQRFLLIFSTFLRLWRQVLVLASLPETINWRYLNTYMEVSHPEVLRTLYHSSLVSLPSPSLSALSNILRIWISLKSVEIFNNHNFCGFFVIL